MHGIKAFISHTIRMVLSNRLRLLLSVCGLFIGILLLTVGSLLIDSYNTEQMAKAESFSENVLSLKVDAEEETVSTLIRKTKLQTVGRKTVSDESSAIYIKEYTNGYYCVLNANAVGTSAMTDGMVLYSYNEELCIPYDAELVSGRMINANDVACENAVCVIDTFTAELLFGDKNPIGQTITMGTMQEGIAVGGGDVSMYTPVFTVAGVIACPQLTSENERKLAKFLHNGTEHLRLTTKVYIPESVYEKWYTEGSEYLTFSCKNAEEYDRLSGYLDEYKEIHASSFRQFELTGKEDVREALKEELQPVRLLLRLVLLLVFLLSGMNSMNTMLFSVKERIGEIGIKKSLGARPGHIVGQFILEGIIMSLGAGLAAMLCGCLISEGIAGLLSGMLYMSFSVHYSVKTLVLPLAAAVLYGAAFSLFPSLYGAGIRVTDALRFE